jgi:thiamine kinase-like enzyme
MQVDKRKHETATANFKESLSAHLNKNVIHLMRIDQVKPEHLQLLNPDGFGERQNYMLSSSKGQFLLRFSLLDEIEKQRGSLLNESAAIRLVQDSGISPKLNYFSDGYSSFLPFIVVDYIKGHTVFRNCENVIRAAPVIAKLHDVKVDSESTYEIRPLNKLHNIVNFYIKKSEDLVNIYNNRISPEFKDAITYARGALKGIKFNNSRMSLLHLDLGFENMIDYGGGIKIIDFELAMIGEPEADISVFFQKVFLQPLFYGNNHIETGTKNLFVEEYNRHSKYGVDPEEIRKRDSLGIFAEIIYSTNRVIEVEEERSRRLNYLDELIKCGKTFNLIPVSFKFDPEQSIHD